MNDHFSGAFFCGGVSLGAIVRSSVVKFYDEVFLLQWQLCKFFF